MKQILKNQDVQWVKPGTLDPLGPVFTFKSGYYRSIRSNMQDFVVYLFDSGIIKELSDQNLICQHFISDYQFTNSDLIVQAETADFLIPANYFTFHTLRICALKWLKINISLLSHKLGLIDAHYGNFLIFNNNDPKWIDLGSIVELEKTGFPESQVGIVEFQQFYLYPLLAAVRHPVINKLIRQTAIVDNQGLSGAVAAYLTNFNVLHHGTNREALLNNLLNAIESISFDWPATTWSDYAITRLDKITSSSVSELDSKSVREKSIFTAIKSNIKKNHILLDLGGNDGYFALNFAAAGYKAYVSDLDESALQRGCQRVGKEQTWKVAFSVRDSMAEEIKADIVLALALTHHLRLTYGHSLEAIAQHFADRTEYMLLTEFMPWGLNVESLPENLPTDYSLDRFLTALKSKFPEVNVREVYNAEAGHPRILIEAFKQ